MLPIGVEDFEKIRKMNFYYVDKTEMIKELLENMTEVTLFTRPRRFGKTLNMSMLQYFFEIGTDSSLFDGLEIAKETKLCDEHLGKYPVISISLKSVEGKSFDDARAMFVRIVSAEAMHHKAILASDKLDRYEKQKYEELLTGNFTNDILKDSLWIISESLYKVYNQKVVILIDEYDVPLSKAYDYGYYSDMVDLIRGIFERVLKTNKSKQLAILTGCMRIAKESIFTGLNNFKIRSITGVRFNEYFGFTDSEVKNLLAYYGFEKKYRSAKTWYDGYKFGDIHVYCPWDVINYVDDLRANPNMRPENYWSNTSSNNIIRRFLNKADDTTRWEIEQLIEGKSIEKEIYQELTYAELDQSINHLWSVLFTTGYLTSESSKRKTKADDESFGSGLQANTMTLKIPNEEIRSIFKNHIYTWFNDQVETDADRYKTFSQAFIEGDAQKIQDMFDAYLMETISIRDTSVRKSMKENFYHGVLLGILKFRRDWIVKSNQESGEGYNDIMIMYNSKKIGIVIEVKYADNDGLTTECEKALGQIEKLHYTDALMEFDPVKIYKYAIACYKKHCKVVMAEKIVSSR